MSQMNNVDHGSFWLSEMIISNDNGLKTFAFVTSLVVLIFTILWYHSKKVAPRLPPGPRSLPIVGYLPFLGRDLLTQFTKMAQTYGPIFKFQAGCRLHVVINTPQLIKEVVRDQDEIFSNRNAFIATSTLSYGCQDIVWSDNNSTWRNVRKIFVHEVLSNKNLEACNYFRRDEVRKTIKNVFNKIGTTVDINEISFSTEANVLTSMVWDNASGGQGEKDSHLVAELQMLVANVIELIGKPNVSDYIPCLAWLDLQGVEHDMKSELKKLDRIIDKFIDDRIKSNSKRSKGEVEYAGKKDFLETLLELKEQEDISMTQIKALLVDIMVAGTETTTLIEWAMAEIMSDPNIMKKIQEELAEVVGINNIVEESHIVKLKYLDATIKETFRLHPIVPLVLPRSPSQDCTIGGYTIPKGCIVIMNAWSIHRDARYWDNPLEFNPDRFLTNDEGAKKWDFLGNNLKYFPFG